MPSTKATPAKAPADTPARAPAKAPARSPAVKAAVKAALTTAPTAKVAPVKSASAKASPAKASPAKAAAATAAAPRASKAPKVRQRPVRDSFTMPEADFSLIATLKARALAGKRETKKSELLRAGLHALAAMDSATLLAALHGLEPIKTGRPKKGH